MKEPVVPVVLRVWKDEDSDVFALFPTLPYDVEGMMCDSYAHVGQHSGACYHGCMARSRPATDAEAEPLLKELKQIGYNVRVIRRANYHHHQQRRQAARA